MEQKAPNAWELQAGNQIKDPDGNIWVVQSTRTRSRRLYSRIGIRKKGTNEYKIIQARDLLKGWRFLFEDAPDQVITNE